MLADALKSACVYDNVVVTHLGPIENPDMIAEVADILLRDDSTDWVMVSGCFRQKMSISLRTEAEDARADKVIRHIVARKGTGGGHPSYAGGQIPLPDDTQKSKRKLEKTILNRFLKQAVKNSASKKRLIQEQ